MRPSLSAVAVGVARAADMLAVAVQLLAVAALASDRTGVVEAGAEVAEKARAATPATSIAASLVPAFIRMPCSSYHPVSSTTCWPLPLVSAHPGPSRGWAANSGRAQRGIRGPGGSGAHGSHTMYSAPRRTSLAARNRHYAAAFTGALFLAEPDHAGPLPGPGRGRVWLRPTDRS